MRIKIQNNYSDGYESSDVFEFEDPELVDLGNADDWWDDEILPLTGDGHGLDSSLGYCYTATVLTAVNPDHVGVEREWCGS